MVIGVWPEVTRSPERTVMPASRPSTCGCRVAERRDLMVATYSLLCGTAGRETGTVCTGIGPPAARPPGGVSCVWQPQTANAKTTQQNAIRPFKTVNLGYCVRCLHARLEPCCCCNEGSAG